ncbi:MAG: hypothetical protein WKF41_19070 [Gaiellaceae bacterium]
MKMKLFAALAAATLLGACRDDDDDGGAGSGGQSTGGPIVPQDQEPGSGDAPPPPPAACGDMNGGGDQHVDFEQLMQDGVAQKPGVMAQQLNLLDVRYDLGDAPSATVTMFRGKPVQIGIRVKLPQGATWDDLSALSPDEIRAQDILPAGFFPLPHPNHPVGGMVFPQFHIDEVLAQTGRDLTRFDLDFDLPDQFLPEFPAAIFLTTRPDLGDVSQGKVVTSNNYYELFKCILNPKQLDGLRLLVTPFAQQQFNLIDDRRSEKPSLGVSCLDCHVNGHSNGATHLVGDIRPQKFRHRIDTPSLRGLFNQQIFGSQRALESVEDFTEFEQAAAYFDGDPVLATKKGVNPLDRLTQVHHMAELEKILDFPPAPKLGLDGKLDPSKATADELAGQELFFGKATCGNCHPAPVYSDQLMHNLQVERFYEPKMINGMMASEDGPIKSFVLRGIKESPPYLHDGRLLTLEDTIEFFNLVLELDLAAAEKAQLLAFLYTL